MELRWLADDFDDDDTQPYKEGRVYICRVCATEIRKRTALCRMCRRRIARQQREAEKLEDCSDDV